MDWGAVAGSPAWTPAQDVEIPNFEARCLLGDLRNAGGDIKDGVLTVGNAPSELISRMRECKDEINIVLQSECLISCGFAELAANSKYSISELVELQWKHRAGTIGKERFDNAKREYVARFDSYPDYLEKFFKEMNK